MYLNQGKFRQNGGCGYTLKPKIMRDADEKGTICLTTLLSIIFIALCDAVYTPNMTEPHHAVAPVNLEITVSS